MYVLDIDKWVGKNWYPALHVSLLKKYHHDEQMVAFVAKKNPKPPFEYEFWDGLVDKIIATQDSQQIYMQYI